MLLHTTSFAYASENADNIKKHSLISSSTTNLFFKYYNFYIYFKKLYPFQKKAKDVRIFKVQKGKLKEIVRAKEAFFENNLWKIENADIVEKIDKDLAKKIKIDKKNEIKLLQGFKPKILDTIYEGKTSFSILDAFYAIKLLQEQDINTQKIRAVLYAQIIYPFFAPFLIVIIFFFVPITQRLASVTLFSFGAIISSLMVWGLLYTLVRLSLNGVLIPEISTILPVVLLALTSLIFYKKF
jgi:lipopolysaccharide export system permease protein